MDMDDISIKKPEQLVKVNRNLVVVIGRNFNKAASFKTNQETSNLPTNYNIPQKYKESLL